MVMEFSPVRQVLILTTSAGLIWAPSILGYNGTEDGPGNNELGYGNEFVHDKNLQRFGFDLPQYSLIIIQNYRRYTKPGTGTRAVPDTNNGSKLLSAIN